MSCLQDEILNCRRRLSHSKTKVTDTSGRVSMEEFSSGVFQSTEVAYTTAYVVDTKPDMQVALVLMGLSMGSQDVVNDESLLRKYDITHVLSLGVEVEKFSGIHYIHMPALDLPEYNLKGIFEHCFSIIDSAREEGGHIFVHCNAGVSRSATIVIAYLMREKNVSFEKAFAHLKKVRPCINPNPGFVKQLKWYETMLSK